MKGWSLLVLGGCLFVVGCMQNPAGPGPATGSDGRAGSPECVSASDCPAAAEACATASCNNGVCEKVPGNAGKSCRAAVSSCDAAEVCDGASINCAADTGPLAACQVSLPIKHAAHERTYTITSVNLAGTGKPVATVSPGAQVTLQVDGSWQMISAPTCAGCATQLYLGIEGTFVDCSDVSSENGTINRRISFFAPETPGVYLVNPAGTWEYTCVKVTVPTTFSQSTIATLVVQ